MPIQRMKSDRDLRDLVAFLQSATKTPQYLIWDLLVEALCFTRGEIKMKMVLISSVVAISIALVAYFILVNSGMDTASVYSGKDVRLQTRQ